MNYQNVSPLIERVALSGPHGMMLQEEAKLLMWLADKTRGSIVELGCHVGITTRLFAERFPHRRVIGVDFGLESLSIHPKQRPERPSHDSIGLIAAGLPNVTIWKKPSRTITYPDGCDFIFIDADHTLKGVSADSGKALRHLSGCVSGIVAWHDYLKTETWTHVARFINRVIEPHHKVTHFVGTSIVAILKNVV